MNGWIEKMTQVLDFTRKSSVLVSLMNLFLRSLSTRWRGKDSKSQSWTSFWSMLNTWGGRTKENFSNTTKWKSFKKKKNEKMRRAKRKFSIISTASSPTQVITSWKKLKNMMKNFKKMKNRQKSGTKEPTELSSKTMMMKMKVSLRKKTSNKRKKRFPFFQ